MTINRRQVVGSAAAIAALSLLPIPVARAATSPEVEAAVARVLDGRAPTEGGITFDVPAVADNGAQVPLTIRVDSPMTEADHVTAIHLIASRNPTPGIGRFRLTARLGRAEVFTRIRLAEAQEVIVLAETADGGVRQAAVRIAVTIGGCVT